MENIFANPALCNSPISVHIRAIPNYSWLTIEQGSPVTKIGFLVTENVPGLYIIKLESYDAADLSKTTLMTDEIRVLVLSPVQSYKPCPLTPGMIDALQDLLLTPIEISVLNTSDSPYNTTSYLP